MASSLTAIIGTRKNRLKRRSGKIFGDVVRSTVLIMVTGIVAIVMVYGYNVVITASFFRVETVTVNGTVRMAESDILRLSGIGLTENIWTVNRGEVSRKIEAHPWIRDVSIGIELPNRLVIQVAEREPAAFVLIEGNLHIMDWHGEIFKQAEKGDNVTLPVVNGMWSEAILDRDLVGKALQLLQYLSQRRTYPMIQNVSEIFGDRDYGFSIFTDSGVCLQVGFGNYRRKLERLQPILVDLGRRNRRGAVSIDLTDVDKVIVKESILFKHDRSARSFEA
ncbi:MAG: FtsQ-type POTRA domain-containing protein [Deltaproteobacteria bacterium]|nr:FtsQ-type POTRA domain-containing protein [Deltaproteobacteria bacterium]MBN2687330.1 FtsQ-type POTRA domain-containing protein [Deltaproteobacteria bacterium]